MLMVLGVGLGYEWLRLLNHQRSKTAVLFFIGILGALCLGWGFGIRVALVFLLVFSVTGYYSLTRLRMNISATKAMLFFWGLLYIGLPLLTIMWVLKSQVSGTYIILWGLFIIWANDIGAYLIGSTLQGPKLCPAISPKKTWSGFVGGLICGVLAAHLAATLFHFEGGWLFLSLLSLGLGIIGTLGDLAESSVKRRCNLKDSGSIIPGHGGLLDRLDSTLFVMPVLALIVRFFSGLF